MPTDMTDLEQLVATLLASGRKQAVIGVSDEPDGSLTTLRFANILRRSADRLCHEAAEVARGHGASWRQIGDPSGASRRRAPNTGSAGRPKSADPRRQRSGGQERNAGRPPQSEQQLL